MKITILFSALFFLVLSACNQKKGKQGVASGIKTFELQKVWSTDTLLRTPESVIYDEKRNLLYVTNVNLEPRLKDGNGFVSKIDLEGKIEELKWVEGLNAPKGTAMAGDTLYVADINELVLIDINRGEIIRKVVIEGAGMINDITSDREGNLYISDTDSGKIYKYSGGNLSIWLGEGLDRPNGLLVEDERLLLASMGSMDLVSIDISKKQKKLLVEDINRGDGIAWAGMKGYYFVSDWSGRIFLVNEEIGKVTLLDTREEGANTADIYYIAEKNLLMVPTFNKNTLDAFRLIETK